MIALPRLLFSRLTALLLAAGACGLASAQTSSIPRLHEHERTVRTPFLVQGCHAAGCTQDSPSLRVLPVDNYDMGPSIARSDSFDVVHYDLVLDVSDYSGQSMQALATIDFTVLQGGGTSMWWDLQGLTVDSVHWNGNAVTFEQAGPELHVDAPAPMTAGEAV